MILERFRAAHLEEIDLQPEQVYLRAYIGAPEAREFEQGGPAYTLRSANGQIALCAGFLTGPECSGLWAFVSAIARKRLIALHGCAQRMLEVAPRLPVITSVEADFEAGHRWVSLLGFTFVRPVPGIGADGRDHHLYEWRPAWVGPPHS